MSRTPLEDRYRLSLAHVESCTGSVGIAPSATKLIPVHAAEPEWSSTPVLKFGSGRRRINTRRISRGSSCFTDGIRSVPGQELRIIRSCCLYCREPGRQAPGRLVRNVRARTIFNAPRGIFIVQNDQGEMVMLGSSPILAFALPQIPGAKPFMNASLEIRVDDRTRLVSTPTDDAPDFQGRHSSPRTRSRCKSPYGRIDQRTDRQGGRV